MSDHSICQTPECGRIAIRLKKTLCYGCYMRMYRKGTTDYHTPAALRMQSRGYLIQQAPGHPLVEGRSGNHEYKHRIVFYDSHGRGPFLCHWCQITVTWATMHVDHLDENKTNNDPHNLVSSCPKCNKWRNYDKTKAALMKANGVFLTAFGKTQCIRYWARDLGISDSSITARLKAGWSIDRALSEPRGKRGPPSKLNKERAPTNLTGCDPCFDGVE